MKTFLKSLVIGIFTTSLLTSCAKFHGCKEEAVKPAVGGATIIDAKSKKK
ncbi:MAG: hypothetical protein O3B09_03260 [Proteobacteria bacterium]|nr:hypothetical protein [Pseudomonadota bacterium]